MHSGGSPSSLALVELLDSGPFFLAQIVDAVGYSESLAAEVWGTVVSTVGLLAVFDRTFNSRSPCDVDAVKRYGVFCLESGVEKGEGSRRGERWSAPSPASAHVGSRRCGREAPARRIVRAASYSVACRRRTAMHRQGRAEDEISPLRPRLKGAGVTMIRVSPFNPTAARLRPSVISFLRVGVGEALSRSCPRLKSGAGGDATNAGDAVGGARGRRQAIQRPSTKPTSTCRAVGEREDRRRGHPRPKVKPNAAVRTKAPEGCAVAGIVEPQEGPVPRAPRQASRCRAFRGLHVGAVSRRRRPLRGRFPRGGRKASRRACAYRDRQS